MFEFKQENTGYKANNVSPKPLDFSKGGWQLGDLKSEFFAPHASIPGIKLSGLGTAVTTSTADLKSDKPADTKPQADNSSAPKTTAAPAQEEPKAAKLELNVPEPPSAANPIVIPAAFAPVMTAGALSGMQRDQARGKSSSTNTNYQDAAEFDLGNESAAVRRARGEQKLRDQLIARDADQDNGSRDLLEIVAQEQQNQWLRDMDRFVEEERNRLLEERSRREQRIAELDRQIEHEENDRDRVAVALQDTRTRLRLREEDIQRLHRDGKITEEQLERLKERLRLKQQEIEDQKRKVDAANQSVEETKKAAAEAGQAAAEAREDETNLTQAQDIYTKSIAQQKEKIKKLEEEIARDEAKVLKDSNGNAVYKDEQGKLYTKGADGSKNTLSDSEQQALKEKMSAEGLVTADTLDEKRKALEQENEALKGYEEGKRVAEQLKNEAADKKLSAADRKVILDSVTKDMQADLDEHTRKLDALRKESDDLKEDIQKKTKELEDIKKKLETATADRQALAEQEKRLQEELAQKNTKVTQLKEERKKEVEKLKEVNDDIEALDRFNKLRNDPDMKARLNSSDPIIRETAKKEMLDTLTPGLRARWKEQQQALEASRAQQAPTQQTAAQQQTPPAAQTAAAPAQTAPAQTAAPTTAAPAAATASADNTSRTGGSAAETVVKASAEVGPPFASAAAGVTPAKPEEATPEQTLVADNTQRQTRNNNNALTA